MGSQDQLVIEHEDGRRFGTTRKAFETLYREQGFKIDGLDGGGIDADADDDDLTNAALSARSGQAQAVEDEAERLAKAKAAEEATVEAAETYTPPATPAATAVEEDTFVAAPVKAKKKS